MDRVLVFLYWAWLVGAVGVICYRVYGRATGKRDQVFEFRERSSTTDDPPSTTHAVPPFPMAARTAQPAGAEVDTLPVATGDHEPALAAAAVDAMGADEIHPAVLAAMRTDAAPDEVTEAPGTTGGLFARDGHQTVSLGTLAPLAETLSGIEMPCDLVPVTELGPRPPRETHRERLVLMTTTTGAGEVASRTADELERLGLEVVATGPSSCVARRRDHSVEIRVHEFPDRVIVGTEAAFPSVPDSAVVVEFITA